MRRNEPYDRGYRARGYDRDYGRRYGYGQDYGPGRGVSFAGASFPMGVGYMPPWGWYGPLGIPAGPWPAYGSFDAFAPLPPPRRPPRRPPRESPAYGRGGDREVRRWAREHGYDVEYAVYPRENRRYR